VGNIVVGKRIVNAAGTTKYAEQALRRIAPAQVACPLETRSEARFVGPRRKRLVIVLDIHIGLDRQVLAQRQAQLARRTRPESRFIAESLGTSVANGDECE
jgi:hypothetical protein